MGSKSTWIMAVALGVLLLAPLATAAEAGGERAGCNCIFCQAKESVQEAAPWLKLFGDVRLREIVAPNLLLDDEDRHFQRFRFRAGATVTPVENLDFNFRMVYEIRNFCQPDRKLLVRNQYFIDDVTTNEIIIDRLNVTWSKILGLPLKAVVGRQDIILGNGWLVLDGTPLDGSRTIFFDAARLTLDMPAAKMKADLIYITNHADTDRWLTPMNDQDFHNHEQDEQGVILYLTNTCLPNTQLDGYFIYKHDERVLGDEPGDIAPGQMAPWQQGAHSDIYTLGGRATHKFDDHWSARGEFAWQFGSKNLFPMDVRQDLCAWGFNSRVTYAFADELQNELHAGYEFLSGEEGANGDRSSQFDPLWGRWPQFSELYVYPVALENRPGETTNMHRINLGWSCVPCDPLKLGVDYHVLFSHHNAYGTSRSRGGRIFTDDGSCRGQLLVGKLTYKFNKHVSGHLLGELFFPGDFYSDNYNDVAAFLRYELMFTW